MRRGKEKAQQEVLALACFLIIYAVIFFYILVFICVGRPDDTHRADFFYYQISIFFFRVTREGLLL